MVDFLIFPKSVIYSGLLQAKVINKSERRDSELSKTSKNFKNNWKFTKFWLIQYDRFLDISQIHYLFWSATSKIRLLQAKVTQKSERRDPELSKTSKNFRNDWKLTKLHVTKDNTKTDQNHKNRPFFFTFYIFSIPRLVILH